MLNETTRLLPGFSHESATNDTQEWYTPKYIFDALGLTFDLDPASPGAEVVPWIPAKTHYTILDDGLSKPWHGRVWCNPPYGDKTAEWVARFVAHHNGVMLVFSRTDTGWFHNQAVKADCICFVRGRISFTSGIIGKGGAGAGAGSMLLGCGDVCAEAVRKCGLGHVVTG